jgi:hypothetical protein
MTITRGMYFTLGHLNSLKYMCTMIGIMHVINELSMNGTSLPKRLKGNLYTLLYDTLRLEISLRPMSLSRFEYRVCGHGQITSKPSIYKAPSYGLQKLSTKMKFWRMKNQCLQDEGVECSSHCMRAFLGDLEGSQRVPQVPNGGPQMPSYSRLNFISFQGWSSKGARS